ncbi:unnamed protein product, partial [Meganyctiphanes norvegica]
DSSISAEENTSTTSETKCSSVPQCIFIVDDSSIATKKKSEPSVGEPTTPKEPKSFDSLSPSHSFGSSRRGSTLSERRGSCQPRWAVKKQSLVPYRLLMKGQMKVLENMGLVAFLAMPL